MAIAESTLYHHDKVSPRQQTGQPTQMGLRWKPQRNQRKPKGEAIMEIGMSSSVSGVQDAFQKNADRAKRIAKDTQSEQGDITKDMAELKQDPQAVKANVAAIKTQDQMNQSLLDLFA